MLYQAQDADGIQHHLHRLCPAFEHLLSAWSGWNGVGQDVYLVNNLQQPEVMGLRARNHFVLLGVPAALDLALDDLFHQRFDQESPWPGDEVQQAWSAEGRPWISLELLAVDHFQQAYHAGFELAPDDRLDAGAYFYWITGMPRYAKEVFHPCRVVHGLELYELLRQGIEYDETGEYTKRCLESGPSFVCEVDGVKVSWSCTHTNHCLGMIYTPPEHRRQGYGRSLAAFQLDYMLATRGLAHCYVITGNQASRAMLNSLGVPHLAKPIVWRKLRWPAGAIDGY